MPFFSDFLYKSICCWYHFELHWQIDVIQMSHNNICFYIYVVGIHLNCIDKLMQFKCVPTTYNFMYMLWVLIWIAVTSWFNSNGYQQYMLLNVVGTHLNCTDKLMQFKWVTTIYAFIYMLWVLFWIALISWCSSNGYQQHTLLYICWGYSFELHWQVDAIQIGTNNIPFYMYVVGTHLNCNWQVDAFQMGTNNICF